MAKSKEELEREIDRLLDQNKMTSSSSIPYSDNTDKFYDSIKTKNKQELDNQARLGELQAQSQRLKNQPDQFAAYKRTVTQADTLQARIALDDVYRDERARTSFSEATRKAFSTEAIASDAAKFGKNTGQGEVHQLARQYTTSQLRQRLGEASVGVTQWGEHAQSIASEYSGTPDQKKEYMQMMSYRQQDIGRMSLIDQAIRAQKRMGIDVGSREESLEKFRGSFERDNMSREISRDIAGGKTGSMNQEMRKLEEAAAKVTKALEAMSKATDRSDENLEKLATSAEEARSEYERQKETVGQMRSSGAGGGGGNRLATMANLASGFAVGYQGLNVDNPMAAMANRIGQVNLANSRANDVLALSQGDMSAYRRITTDQYERSVAHGNEMRDNAQKSEWISAGSSFLNIFAAGTEGAIKGGMAGGKKSLAGAVAGGISATAGATGSFVTQVNSAAQNIGADRAMLQQTQMTNELFNAMNMVNDTNSQKAFDYRTGVMYASRGIGAASYNEHVPGDSQGNRQINSGRNETFRLMEQDETIKSLRGLDAGERTSLLSYGVNAMGARMGGQRGIDMMVTGQNLAQSGYLQSAQQFIGMSSQLTKASGDENVMLRGLEVAVSKGMRGANVFQELAAAIGGVGQAIAGSGSKLSENFAARFAATAGDFQSRGYSGEQSIAMTKSGMEVANAIMSNRNMTVGNIQRAQNLRDRLGVPMDEFSKISMESMQKLKMEDFDAINTAQKRIKTAGPAEKKRLEEEYDQLKMSKGVYGRSDEELKIAQEEAVTAIINDKIGQANPKMAAELIDATKKGTLNKYQQSYLAGFGIKDALTFATKTGREEGALAKEPVGEAGWMEKTTENLKGMGDKFVAEGLKNPLFDLFKNTSVIEKSVDVNKLSQEAKTAGETGKVPEKAFSESFEKLQEVLNKNAEVFANFQKYLQETSKTNDKAANTFSSGVTTFVESLKKPDAKIMLKNNNSSTKTKD